MQLDEGKVRAIVAEIGRSFPTFGGGRASRKNPVSHALKAEPLQFAAGVNVEDIVRLVLSKA